MVQPLFRPTSKGIDESVEAVLNAPISSMDLANWAAHFRKPITRLPSLEIARAYGIRKEEKYDYYSKRA